MQLFSPTTTEAVEATVAEVSAKRSFGPSAPVEAGEYTMKIQSEPLIKTSKAGNAYAQLMLVHTEAKGATAVYPNFNGNEIGDSQFRQMLLALGLDVAQVASATIEPISDERNEKGDLQGAVKINGESITLAGRTLRVYLSNKDNTWNGQTTKRNEVARFIIG